MRQCPREDVSSGAVKDCEAEVAACILVKTEMSPAELREAELEREGPLGVATGGCCRLAEAVG